MSEQPTPYDLIFDAEGFDEARFEQVREQDAARVAVPLELFLLPAAGELLRELLPEGHEPATHSALVTQVSALLFHAYRFWLHGRQVHRFTASALQPLLDGAAPPADWLFTVPGGAGYVQWPRNAVWARVEQGAVPEPVDGFFWSAPVPEDDSTPARLDVLLALGVRPGRPGISVVEVTAETTVGIEQWARTSARPDGTDFDNILPGGELQGYHALTTHAEALKLALLCFWRIGHATGTVEDEGSNRVITLEDG